MFALSEDLTSSDSLSMLYYLNAGLKAEEARRKRIRDGAPLPEDLMRESL